MARHYKSKSGDGVAVYRSVVGSETHESSRDLMQSKDGSMISQDPSAMSGLPRKIMYKAYPNAEYNLDGDLYGNIIGIDRQMAEDAAVTKRVNTNPRKI